MPIVPLYGHEPLRQRLEDKIRTGVFPSSVLLHGPRGIGKQRLALHLGQALLCERPEPPCGQCQHCRFALELAHPDLHWFFPRPRLKDADASHDEVVEDYAEAIAERLKQGGLHAPSSGTDGLFIATIRAVVHQASLSPAIAKRKIFILGDAERMVPQEGAEFAANALLKLLEEPPPNAFLILTSSEPGALLPTIRSRVVAVRVPPLPPDAVRHFLADPLVAAALEGSSRPEAREDLVARAAGAPGVLFGGGEQAAAMESARRLLAAAESGERREGYRLALAQGSAKARGAFSDMLDALSILLHGRLRQGVSRGDDRLALGASRAVGHVERAKALATGNVSPQLIAAALLRELSESLR